ncbi:hypothetical protein B0H21DRAFT_808516 [Amylocystis lapponica]|nr:hypothetical protein B0H21DRAFT_808516 [Amylocystis lapponica]
MAEIKGPAIASNKLAMSRALGAAFLNHQVEQLEKTVTNSGPGNGNWRERRLAPAHNHNGSPEFKRARAAPAKGAKRRDADGSDYNGGEEKIRRRDDYRVQKDADIVVVDASVLVHALPQVKKWCRDGREEVLIVPLEALNTLDLLKKGTSTLAQRARAASRILEAQVGTNPRIRVQRDDAFVLWDSIFQDLAPGVNPGGSPEWVRRIICCARWEVEHAGEGDGNSSDKSDADEEKKPRVVLAVLSQSSEVQSEAIGMPTSTAPSPVPLPAPQTNRHEPRSSGALVTSWANKARLDLFEVKPSAATGPAAAPNGAPTSQDASFSDRRSAEPTRRSAEEERSKRGLAPGSGVRGRRNSHLRAGNERAAPISGARPGSSSGLVERPPAVMAMMEMVSQPSRVVRVLARGEKLDPDS